jgi:glycosyltransferase involved in cell wall biosynthesis
MTYKHEKYIQKSICSALMQRTTFPVEIVAGVDYSTDRTFSILSKIANNSSNIKIIKHQSCVGANINQVSILRNCTGKYVAMLEGDDYWTDSHKLQKQVEYLEKHPKCSICFHNVSVLDSATEKITGNLLSFRRNQRFLIDDILKSNIIPTLSCVYRNGYINPIPVWFDTVFPGDWPIHILNCLHGYAYYMNETMGVYRSHSQGVTKKLSCEFKIKKYIEMLNLLKNGYLPQNLQYIADQNILNYEQQLCNYYRYQTFDLLKFAFHYMKYSYLRYTV